MNISGQSIRNLEQKEDTQTFFCSCELDIDPMTLIYELDLDLAILQMDRHTTNELLGQGFRQLEHY